jgi:hypothetical protein
MDFSENSFLNAADKFTDTAHRMGKWEIWAKYEIRLQKHGGRYVLAVEPGDSELPPRVNLENALEETDGTVRPGSHEEELVRRAVERRNLRKEGWVYYPLVRKPDLFLKFARLADGDGLDNADTVDELDTDKNAEALLDWAWEHGTLGLTPADEKHWFRGASTRGGKADTVSAFAAEAWRANACLRLYEAATAREIDADFIASYMYPSAKTFLTRTPARTREWALNIVATETQHKVAGNAYPALYGEVGRFVSGWSFSNLLGAMWLQMFWLLASEQEPRRCRHCDKVIGYGGSDQHKRGPKRKFCDKTCRQSYHYETVTKPRRRAARRL